MKTDVQIKLLGPLEIWDGGGNLYKFTSRKARALLGYLVLQSGQPQLREKLTHLLWSNRESQQARNSLNQALYEISRLEKDLGVELLDRAPELIALHPRCVSSDLQELDDALDKNPDTVASMMSWELLEGLDGVDAAFGEWLRETRAGFRQKISGRLLEGSETAEQNQDFELAAAFCRAVVQLEPYHEAARRRLMLCLSKCEQRAEAVRQYGVCKELLREDLGVEPEVATTQLYEQIKRSNSSAPQPDHLGADPRQRLITSAAPRLGPVIAVVPFRNLSDEPEHRFFIEGLAEDLIQNLSTFRWFRVLARTSTFLISSDNVSLPAIHKSHGADYVVSGSVRRGDGKLRITVELVNCPDGDLLWTRRFFAPIDRLFEIQDEITLEIGAAVEPSLESREAQKAFTRPVNDMEAYDHLVRGNWLINSGDLKNLEQARANIERAVELSPNSAAPLAALAQLHYRDANTVVGDEFEDKLRMSRDTAHAALRWDRNNPRALRALGGANSFLRDYQGALDALNRSVSICPNYATSYSGLAFAYDLTGKFEEAKPAADETIRLRPNDIGLYRCIVSKSLAEYQTGEYEAATTIARDSMRHNDSWWFSNIMLAASLAQQGKTDEARASAEKFKRNTPALTLDMVSRLVPFEDASHGDHLIDGLKRAHWSN